MKKRDVTDEERDLWLQEIEGKKPAPKSINSKNKPSDPPLKKSTPAASLNLNDVIPDKKRAASRPEATLDLHGHTQDEAHVKVVRFIQQGAARDYKVVLIITGKGRQGGGILRQSVPKWLDSPQLRPFILAMTYATAKEGGEGALRVHLKRKR